MGCAANAAPASTYAVVVSQATFDRPEWRRVVEALERKHAAFVVRYPAEVASALPELRARFPRRTCVVARPEEASRELVARVHRLVRQFDNDPYPDCLWGILTGRDAADALRIAEHAAPLTVRKVAAGTEVALEMCEEGVWYCELKQGRMVRKEPGKPPVEQAGPADTTEALVDTLNRYHADLFVTSGHATQRDWMIGYGYRNGSFRHEGVQLYGLDTRQRRLPIRSPNPKVYLPVGNCLMGHIDRPDCMALAWMASAGVHQMIGYTVPTWYGYAGWGCLDYFLEQPGRFSLAEAFLANQVALLHRLATFFPERLRADADPDARASNGMPLTEAARAAGLRDHDGRGLLFDRDVLAFYGDPGWEARMARGPCAWEQQLGEKDGTWILDILPRRGAGTFKPINRNGSQRGGRPIVHFLPRRLHHVRILSGEQWRPLVTDDFVLVPHPGEAHGAQPIRVVFTAR